jgi:hypothetical protein
MSSLSPPQKAVVAWHAALILVRASFGRMYGHWRRGGIVGALCHVGHRFDWSVGSVPNYVRIMRHGSMVHCSIHHSHSAAFDHLLKRYFDRFRKKSGRNSSKKNSKL